MSCEINDRITLLRKHLKLSQTAFGERIGVSRSVIQNIDDKNTEPKPLLIQQISKVYNVDPYWLETGEGEMFLEADNLESLLDFAKAMHSDKDLAWLRVLCEYIAGLSPEERSDVSRYVSGIAAALQGNKKEQE